MGIYNEPIRIIPLLENFKHIQNLLVLLDSADTQTETILIKNAVKFKKRPLGFNSFSEPKKVKWVLNQISTDYFLCAHASMYFSKGLLDIFDLVSNEKIYDGIKTSMCYYSHKKLVQRPFLFKKSTACYFYKTKSIKPELAQIHDEYKLSKSANFLILKPTVDNSIHVFRDDDMPIITSKHIGYAKREAMEFIRDSNQPKMTIIKILFSIIKSFSSGYIRMGGFLAGIEGLVYHLNFAIYKYLVCSHIWELQNKKTFINNRQYHSNFRLEKIGSKHKIKSE